MARTITPITDENFKSEYVGEPWYEEGKYFVSRGNFELVDHSNDPKHVEIHDVTLRDGEQRPGITFTEDERVLIGEYIIDMGVDRIEAGMPIVSDIQFNAMKRISKLNLGKTQLSGFGRALPKDVERIADTGASCAVIEHCMDPFKCRWGYGLTPETMVQRMVTALKRSKELGLKTVYMGWDWFRGPLNFQLWFMNEVLQEVPDLDGVTVVDTTGCTLPGAVYETVKALREQFPQLAVEYHGHNDFNLGVACSLAAVKGGATVMHTAMNALGERTGNVATEELVLALEILNHIDTGVDMSKIDKTSKIIAEIAKSPIANNKPILGLANYIMENGVGTDIMLKMKEAGKGSNPASGPLSPSVIGKYVEDSIALGKNSGNSAIKLKLEKFGLEANDEQRKAILNDVKTLGVVTKNTVSDEQFLEIYKKYVK